MFPRKSSVICLKHFTENVIVSSQLHIFYHTQTVFNARHLKGIINGCRLTRLYLVCKKTQVKMFTTILNLLSIFNE